jgi:hypothetical protein
MILAQATSSQYSKASAGGTSDVEKIVCMGTELPQLRQQVGDVLGYHAVLTARTAVSSSPS